MHFRGLKVQHNTTHFGWPSRPIRYAYYINHSCLIDSSNREFGMPVITLVNLRKLAPSRNVTTNNSLHSFIGDLFTGMDICLNVKPRLLMSNVDFSNTETDVESQLVKSFKVYIK